jgi:hypothetical protein
MLARTTLHLGSGSEGYGMVTISLLFKSYRSIKSKKEGKKKSMLK